MYHPSHLHVLSYLTILLYDYSPISPRIHHRHSHLNTVIRLTYFIFQLDFAKLGPLAGYTNPRSCSNAFARIKKKLADLADASLPAGNSTENDDDAKASANTPKGKAKSAKPKEDPSSKSRPTPKRKAPKRKAGDQATDDESLTEENGNAIDHADSATDSEGEAPNGKKKVTAVTKSKTSAAAKSKATTNGKSNKAKKVKVEDTEDNVPAPDTKRMFPNLKDPGT